MENNGPVALFFLNPNNGRSSDARIAYKYNRGLGFVVYRTKYARVSSRGIYCFPYISDEPFYTTAKRTTEKKFASRPNWEILHVYMYIYSKLRCQT